MNEQYEKSLTKLDVYKRQDEFVLRKAVAGHHAKASFSLAFPARER